MESDRAGRRAGAPVGRAGVKIDRTHLERAASETRFQAEPLEKVLQLLGLLEALRSHPFLENRLALKGGTALNLFLLDLPRLSVDVDLNVIHPVGRDEMLAERPQLEEAVRAVCAREGFAIRHVPEEHAGGKWRLGYERSAGGTGSIELDLNFLMRVPIWTPSVRDSIPIAGAAARRITLLDEHELAGGKLAALFGRNASRDLYDAVGLIRRGGLDAHRLRLSFVAHGAINRRDWRTVALDELRLEAGDADRRLTPLLRADLVPTRGALDAWCAGLVAECREGLAGVLPFTAAEFDFLEHLNGRGEIAAELLTSDGEMQARLRSHPGLLWKAQNVRQHLNLREGGGVG